ncbi:MAG: phage holin family protein [Candidatus Magasanikbacteria bacterium]|nr:phage holin family protein [Candidatus Magasanikbacteria bacterium]
MKILLRWLVNTLALLGLAYYLPGIEVGGFYAALITALVLGLINALVRPLIILLTLPINVLTLGLFTLVINALLFWFVSTVVKGFEVAGFWPAFWGALIMSVVSWVLGMILKD